MRTTKVLAVAQVAWATARATCAPRRLARGVTDLRTAARSVRRGGVLLLASCVVFAWSADVPDRVAVVVRLGAAGHPRGRWVLHDEGSWEIGFGSAPADKQGQYRGFCGTGTAVARTVGALLLTTLVLGGGSGAGWCSACCSWPPRRP